jgi:O-antigen/teichoic acid export membrane protein
MDFLLVAVFKQWPIYFIGRILPAGIAFFGIALYTRFLDPGTFGIYALLLSTSFLIGTTCFAWLRVATLRMSGTIDPAEEPDYAATILVAYAGMSLVTAALIIGVIRISQPQVSWPAVLLTAGTAIASGWFELNVTACQSRLQLITYSALQAVRATGTLVGSLLLIVAGLKVNALLGGFIIGNLLGLGAIGVWKPALRGKVRRAMVVRLWRFGWPSSVVSLSSFSATFQNFLIQSAVGSAALGVFAVATSFATQSVALLMGTAALAGQPLAFRARDNGTHEQLIAQLRSNARLVFAIGLGSTAGLIALAGPLVNVYLGPRFRADGVMLVIISALAVFVGGMRTAYFEQAFEIAFHTRPIAVVQTVRVVINVVLALVAIHFYGVLGAVVAFLTTELIVLTLTIVWSRRHLRMPIPLVSFAKVAAASAVMIGVVHLVPGRDHLAGLALAVIVGVAVYGLSFGVLYLRTLTALVRVRWPALLGAARP